MRLAFKFVNAGNKEGGAEVTLPLETPVAAVRAAALASWPAAALGPPPAEGLRLVCMGRMWSDDNTTLAQLGVPSFEWPTPVHVVANAPRGKQLRVAEPDATGSSWCCAVQ